LWGQQVTNYLIAVASGALSKAGGNFTLTADVNFGASYGLVSSYFKSRSSNIAASGVLRLANTDKVAFRNNANGADLELGVSTSDRLQFGGVNIPTTSSTDTLTNKTLTSPVINTPTGIVKGDVGLGNVDNTSDANKPVSTAQQTALDLKADTASPTLTGTTTVRGTLLLQNTSGAQPELQLSEDPDNGTNKITIKAPATLSGDYTLTLPTDDGGANQVLQTDGSGVLSWTTVASTVTTTEGDTIYRGASADQRLAGNTATTKKWLRQVGTGSASAAPSWEEVDTLKGQTSGSSVSAGYVGEVISAAVLAGTNNATSATTLTNDLTLTAGIWRIVYFDTSYRSSTPSSGNSAQATARIQNITDNTTIAQANSYQYITNVTNDYEGMYTGSFHLSAVVNISGSKTYRGQGTLSANQGAVTTRAGGAFFAVRIA
jgi:hypothetical protein